MDTRSIATLPVLFIGHGSPMNAIETNAFTQALARLGTSLPRPRAVLCISAHWLTEGTWVTHMAQPRTIHDFYGFPKDLFDVQYPAPGSSEVAEIIRAEILNPSISLDDANWGLDHGTWAVLKHLYPMADVPVLQLSIDARQPPEFHHRLGQQLKVLRDRGVLIVGSGNVVHNLRRVDMDPDAKAFDWAVEFDEWVKGRLLVRDHAALVTDFLKTKAGQMSVPTLDHYLPLLYVLGATENGEALQFEYESMQHASISMRSFQIG